MKIWVDDERAKPGIEWFHALNSSDAIRALEIYKGFASLYPTLSVEAISLDHDLGGNDNTRRIVLWMIENDYWPQTIYVHTANPVGREWLEGMVNRYGPGISR